MATDEDFLFMGNIGYGSFNWAREKEGLRDGLRIGPALDPRTGEYTTQWPTMVGYYVLRGKISESAIVRDTEGRPITLDMAINMALATVPRGRY